jgi:hypothetical protein
VRGPVLVDAQPTITAASANTNTARRMGAVMETSDAGMIKTMKAPTNGVKF